MRKLLAVLLVSVMIFGLAACGTQNDESPSSDANSSSDGKIGRASCRERV